MSEELTLAQFIARARVMHSFLPDDDERTKNEYVADELVAVGYRREESITGPMVARAWITLFADHPKITVEQVRAALEAAARDD